ncbi:MAG: hypothetical protein DRQ97_13570 [Gammaproteobacteria bacterium]|nr:MAG: hypothetical protein DRQ97_13570 [Gammaproteobacteria bacterium]
MTEYEISDLLQSSTSIMYMDGAAFMTLLSAYIIVVHLVGRTLTKFQIAFINFTFIGLAISSMLGWLSFMGRISALLEDLAELNSNSAFMVEGGSEATIIYFTFRTLVVLGAIIYMFQIRRSNDSKTDT